MLVTTEQKVLFACLGIFGCLFLTLAVLIYQDRPGRYRYAEEEAVAGGNSVTIESVGVSDFVDTWVAETKEVQTTESVKDTKVKEEITTEVSTSAMDSIVIPAGANEVVLTKEQSDAMKANASNIAYGEESTTAEATMEKMDGEGGEPNMPGAGVDGTAPNMPGPEGPTDRNGTSGNATSSNTVGSSTTKIPISTNGVRGVTTTDNFIASSGTTEPVSGTNAGTASASGRNLLFYSYWAGKKVAWYGDGTSRAATHISLVNQYFQFDSTIISNANLTIAGSANSQALNYTAIPKDVKAILIMAGYNDWKNNIPLGNAKVSVNQQQKVTNSMDNYYGACHHMFENLATSYQNVYILVLGSPVLNTEEAQQKNALGLTIQDYSKALCEAAGVWGVQAVDLSNIKTEEYASMVQQLSTVQENFRLLVAGIIQEICNRKLYSY